METIPKTGTADQPTALYRFYDTDDNLLYVGITVELGWRWKQHARREWWRQVTRATVEHHPSRDEAAAAERTAIQQEHPRWNVIHKPPPPKPVPLAPAPSLVVELGDDIERMIGDTAGLTCGQVANLMGAGRSTIHRWVKEGRFRYRLKGKIRLLHPEDVRRELDEYRRIHNEPGE